MRRLYGIPTIEETNTTASKWPVLQCAAMWLLFLISCGQLFLLLWAGAGHGNDFKHLWAGAWLITHGLNPYNPEMMFKVAENYRLGGVNPFVYLPSTAWMLAPLAALPFPFAKFIWMIFNWLLAWLIVFFGPRLLQVGNASRGRLAGAAFLCAAFPFYRQMTAGQMNVVTAAFLLVAASLLLRNRDAWCGVVLGIGFAWKIAPILLILAMLPLKRPRAFIAGILTCLIVIIAMFAVTPYDTFIAGFQTIGEMGYGRSTWSQFGNDFYRDPFNQSINALLHHLFTENPHSKPWAILDPATVNQITLIITLVFGLSWLIAVWNQMPHRRHVPWQQERENAVTLRLFWAAVLLMLLAPSLLWDHYFVQLLPMIIWLFGMRSLMRRPLFAVTLLLILILLCIPWQHQAPEYKHGGGILLMSLRLWPMLGLYWLLMAKPSIDTKAPEI